MFGVYFLFKLVCLVDFSFSYLVKRNYWWKQGKFQWWQHNKILMRKNLINMWITYLTLVNSEEGGRRVIFVFCHSARKNVHVLFDDVTIQNSALKPKKVFLIRLARHSVSAFDFNEIWRSATWKSFFFFFEFENKIEKSII